MTDYEEGHYRDPNITNPHKAGEEMTKPSGTGFTKKSRNVRVATFCLPLLLAVGLSGAYLDKYWIQEAPKHQSRWAHRSKPKIAYDPDINTGIFIAGSGDYAGGVENDCVLAFVDSSGTVTVIYVLVLDGLCP